jgi:hypothetical protein
LIYFAIHLSPAEDQVDHEQHDDRTDEGHAQAGQVETSYTLAAKQAEYPATHTGADDTSDDIGDAAHLVIALGEDAGQPAIPPKMTQLGIPMIFTPILLDDYFL